MSEQTSSGINQRFLPFSILSENRTEPFTPNLEAAAVFSLAELERAKGGGLIIKQPEETITYIAKMGYPLWLFPWSEIALFFDGLNQNSYTLPYEAVPAVNAFLDNLKRGARTRETHSAFLSDNLTYFQASPAEKGLPVNGLMIEPQFLTEFDSYRREASKNSGEKSRTGLLTPTLDESVILSGIHELDDLHINLQTSVENLYRCMKFLNRVTHQYEKELRSEARDVKEEFDSRIKEEEEVVAPIVNQLKDEYDFRMNSLAKSFEKQQLPVQQEKARLEKSREHAVARIEQYKLEARTHADKGQPAAEEKWKEKASKTRKELSEIENQLKQTEKTLKELEEKRSIEIFNLREELETKVKEARKSLLELEASRDAKILIHRQEIEKLEKQTKEISDQISRTAKLLEANIAQFGKLGVKKELGLEGNLLYYLPFYVVCYQAESKKRYMILPPSVVNTVGVFAKLKGALGMAKIKSLLSPRFKTVTSLIDSTQVLTQQNPVFETEINELGAKNNILTADEVREDIKKGLERLRNEGWLSDKEFGAIEQRIGELS
jgi:hypothetical protein